MRRLLTLLALMACAPAFAGAQDIRVSGGRANWSASATTVTATFMIHNTGAHATGVVPHVELPRGWQLVTGNASIAIEPAQSALLLVSAMVPVKTVAAAYYIRLALYDTIGSKRLALDSISVTVLPRRAIDVTVVNHPSFILSGKSYEAEFTIRNRGNVPANLALRTRSTLGSAMLPTDTLVLRPSESRTLRVQVS
jgi:hypothetical protein